MDKAGHIIPLIIWAIGAEMLEWSGATKRAIDLGSGMGFA
jgi:hypothetical protein